MSQSPIKVAVAAIADNQNRVLITQRAKGTHQGGKWEFPGGKCKKGEAIGAALKRELIEELGIKPIKTEPLITVTHPYPDKMVTLVVEKVLSYTGLPEAREGQPMKWQSINKLDTAIFPAADFGIIRALQLPSICVITPELQNITESDFLLQLEKVLNSEIRLLIFRNHSLDKKQYIKLAKKVLTICDNAESICMLNMAQEWISDIHNINIHLTSSRLMKCRKKPINHKGLLSASCHNLEEIEQANKIGVDFILLSPIAKTASHIEVEPMGWEKFREYAQNCAIPVFALGGMCHSELNLAKFHGAQGVAGISGFWSRGTQI